MTDVDRDDVQLAGQTRAKRNAGDARADEHRVE